MMEHNINSLKNYSIEANDGLIGEVKEFYFDDQSWKIRYLIVETGTWLFGRKVLIPFEFVKKKPWKTGIFNVNLTKKEIENSPDIDTDKPVSQQQDLELYSHFPYQRFGGNGFYAGSSASAMALANDPTKDEKKATSANTTDDDIHLRSTNVLTDYHIQATDGEIGHIHDFIIDESGQIVHLVMDTQNWIGGKKVLIAVELVKEIKFIENKVYLKINKSEIEESTPFYETNYIDN